MKQNMHRFVTVLFFTALLGVVSCKTTDTPVIGTGLNDITGMHDETEARLSTAANNAIAEGKTNEALGFYSKLYKDNHTQDVALNYAQLLRKTGDAPHAIKVLRPFVNGPAGTVKNNAAPIMINEYAAAVIETGNYDVAEAALNKVLEDQKAARFHADAYNLLGIVLDAKGQHKEAEQSYRQALDGWKGDPTSVMNNLGLCLAAQGMFDESLATLRQALIKAPHKQEIARNIQMVTNLRKALVPTAPISVTTAPKNN